MYDDPDHQLEQGGDHEARGGRRGGGAPGRSTLTSRMPASATSIARAVVAQLKAAGAPRVQLSSDEAHAVAAEGTSGGGGPLPFLDQIQRAFGHHDVGGVSAHVGGAAAEAADALGAHAYAAGDAVAFASSPDLRLAAHEAAHVVQQRAGVRLAGGLGQAGDEYERHADEVADGVVRGDFVQDLLGGMAHRGLAGGPAVQREAVEQIRVPWGDFNVEDDSELDVTAIAEVWVAGVRTSSHDLSDHSASVEIQPGQRGFVRVAIGISYLIDEIINDEGWVQETAAMEFSCDAAGQLTWVGHNNHGRPAPTTTAFTVKPTALASGRHMDASFEINGPARTGGTMGGSGGVGGGEVPANVEAHGTTGAVSHPAGCVLLEYGVNIVSRTEGHDAAASDRDPHGGGGGGGGGGAAHGGNSAPQTHNENNNTVSPVINVNPVINVTCPPPPPPPPPDLPRPPQRRRRPPEQQQQQQQQQQQEQQQEQQQPRRREPCPER